MSFDHFYTQVNGQWVEATAPNSKYWVDITHGGPFCIDERYLFPDLNSATEFYREGWKGRVFTDITDLDGLYRALYSGGKLIEEKTVHLDRSNVRIFIGGAE